MYFLKYDVYRSHQFVCTRVTRFFDKEQSDQHLQKWGQMNGGWGFQNVTPATEQDWLNNPNRLDHTGINADLHATP